MAVEDLSECKKQIEDAFSSARSVKRFIEEYRKPYLFAPGETDFVRPASVISDQSPPGGSVSLGGQFSKGCLGLSAWERQDAEDLYQANLSQWKKKSPQLFQ
jgi:hypothetical protein